MLSELAGPFGFGLTAFTLIFAATELLNIGKLVSNEHAPLWAAVAVFAWSLPGDIVLVIPMAL
ncbi:MAG: LptF/LptG family permease, partial [Candidatus Cybelea sp.]